MTLKIQLIIGTMIVIAFLLIVNMIRKKKLNLRYGLSWLTVLVLVLILDLCPAIPTWLSERMGVELPINMLFFMGFCFALLIIFGLTVIVSGLSNKLKRLTQELALLELRQRELEAKQEK